MVSSSSTMFNCHCTWHPPFGRKAPSPCESSWNRSVPPETTDRCLRRPPTGWKGWKTFGKSKGFYQQKWLVGGCLSTHPNLKNDGLRQDDLIETQYFWENNPNGNQLPPTRKSLQWYLGDFLAIRIACILQCILSANGWIKSTVIGASASVAPQKQPLTTVVATGTGSDLRWKKSCTSW